MDTRFSIYEYDELKRLINKQKHAIDFMIAVRFEWESAQVVDDDRKNYGESREVATGFIGERIYVMVFVRRNERIRIISLRKANERERKNYERSKET